MIWHIIGWISAIFGILYPIPQMIRTIKDGHAQGISRKFILCWGFDKFFATLLMFHLQNTAMEAKYVIGLTVVTVIAFYKFIKAPDNTPWF